jgi:hypothetical protein
MYTETVKNTLRKMSSDRNFALSSDKISFKINKLEECVRGIFI